MKQNSDDIESSSLESDLLSHAEVDDSNFSLTDRPINADQTTPLSDTVEPVESHEHNEDYLDNEQQTLRDILGDSEELRNVFQSGAQDEVDDALLDEAIAELPSPTEPEIDLDSEHLEQRQDEIEDLLLDKTIAELPSSIELEVDLGSECLEQNQNEIEDLLLDAATVELPSSIEPKINLSSEQLEKDEVSSPSIEPEVIVTTSKENDLQGQQSIPLSPTGPLVTENDRLEEGGHPILQVAALFITILVAAYYMFNLNQQHHADITLLGEQLTQQSEKIDQLSRDAMRVQQLEREIAVIKGSFDKESNKNRYLHDEVMQVNAAIERLNSEKKIEVPSNTAVTKIVDTVQPEQKIIKPIATPIVVVNRNTILKAKEPYWVINLFSELSKDDVQNKLQKYVLDKLTGDLEQQGLSSDIIKIKKRGIDWYRSRVVGFGSKKAAQKYALTLQKTLGVDTWVSRGK
ncbi:MAG: hypothetical protein L3J28_08810 [Candidatus Polarisedimenticolaceae bacterium]|nr:hypothetical protein [Candidatus Polarisedimenticolaceae bacterium]